MILQRSWNLHRHLTWVEGRATDLAGFPQMYLLVGFFREPLLSYMISIYTVVLVQKNSGGDFVL